MKYLIVGLGNIGSDYAGTRHNIGFAVADALAADLGGSFRSDRLGEVAEGRHKGRIFVLLKPSTFMNLSGRSVAYWIQKTKVPLENVLVVSDDLNLPFGKLRLRPNGADGGHNGLKDITEVLGSNNYARLRLGIGDTFARGKQVDYVLGRWSEEELKGLPDILKKGTDCAKTFGVAGLAQAMNLYNK